MRMNADDIEPRKAFLLKPVWCRSVPVAYYCDDCQRFIIAIILLLAAGFALNRVKPNLTLHQDGFAMHFGMHIWCHF